MLQNNQTESPLPDDRKQAPVPKTAASAERTKSKKRLTSVGLAVLGIAGAGYVAWSHFREPPLPPGFARSNGRIEAAEVDIATKLAGRVIDELVDEGDFLDVGQVVARMDIATLEAQHREAVAKLGEAKAAIETARSTLSQRESQKAAAQSSLAQREAELRLAASKLTRRRHLIKGGGTSQEEVDTEEAKFRSSEAAVNSAKADIAAADAAVSTARANIISAEAGVAAAQATIERIQADIEDSTLKAPRS